MLEQIRLKFTLTFFEIALVVSVIDVVVVVVVVGQEVVGGSVTEAVALMQLSTGKPSISGKSLAGHGNEPGGEPVLTETKLSNKQKNLLSVQIQLVVSE